MDGTLLRKDKTVSERTKKAIEDARKKGVTVVLADSDDEEEDVSSNE